MPIEGLIEAGRQHYEMQHPGHRATHGLIGLMYPGVTVEGLEVECVREIPVHTAYVGEICADMEGKK